MNHKIRGFYPFKGLFLQVDIRVCERILSQMDESRVMVYRGKFHALIEEFYNELAAVKADIEVYEETLNSLDKETATDTENIEEKAGSKSSKEKKLRKGDDGYEELNQVPF